MATSVNRTFVWARSGGAAYDDCGIAFYYCVIWLTNTLPTVVHANRGSLLSASSITKVWFRASYPRPPALSQEDTTIKADHLVEGLIGRFRVVTRPFIAHKSMFSRIETL